MKYRVTRLYFLFVVITSNTFLISYGQKEHKEDLKRGKYKVGFYSTVRFDPAQNYPFYLDGSTHAQKAPKPLVINVWYPATVATSAKAMLHKEYTIFQSKNNSIVNWLAKLSKYNNDAIITELFRKEKKDLDAFELSLFDSLMNTSTHVFRDAKPIKQKFPFVIYAQGSGGTVEDNAIFCELLASHGFVVIGSSFQYNEPDYFGPSGPHKGTRDIAFLLSFAHSLPNVNYNKAGMVGHSLGAQKMLHFMSQGGAPFDALISLETTQEYHTTRNKLWSYVGDVERGLYDMQGHYLFAADASAFHVLADQMRRANRYYLNTSGFSHNDYISQGILRKFIVAKKAKSIIALERYAQAKDKYTDLCNYMVQFLNAKLNDDSVAWETTVEKLPPYKQSSFGIERLPFGVFTSYYKSDQSYPPTPRQLKFMMTNNHLDSIIRLLNKFWEKDSKNPIYHPYFIYPMLDYLLEKDTSKAISLYQTYTRLVGDSAINARFIEFSKLYKARFMGQDSDSLLNALYLLNPNDQARIRELIEKTKK